MTRNNTAKMWTKKETQRVLRKFRSIEGFEVLKKSMGYEIWLPRYCSYGILPSKNKDRRILQALRCSWGYTIVHETGLFPYHEPEVAETRARKEKYNA